MSEASRISNISQNGFHAASHYDSPDDVVSDAKLSAAEKRAILSSWASDMYAVESNPALRDIPGMTQPLRLIDILAALRELDGDIDPPRGGAVMRVWHPTFVDAVAGTSAASAAGGPRPARRRSWVAARS
jgi:hypothetical protein